MALREWHRRIPDYTIAAGAELVYQPALRQIDSLPLVFSSPAGRGRPTSVDLRLSDDQQLLQETTRKFLEEHLSSRNRPTAGRRRAAPATSRPGGRAEPSWAGARSWSPRRTVGAASPGTACSTWCWWPRRWGAWSRPGRSSRSTWWPRRCPGRAPTSSGASCSPVCWTEPARPRGAGAAPAAGVDMGGAVRATGHEGGLRPRRDQRTDRGGCRVRPASGDGGHHRRPHPAPAAGRPPRGHRPRRCTAWTSCGGTPRSPSKGWRLAGTWCSAMRGMRRRRRRAPAGDGGGPPVRRDGGRHRPGPRVHHRVRVRPLLVRPAARLLSGVEAPFRRPEALGRGLAGHGRGGRPQRGRRCQKRRRAGQCGQVLYRGARPGRSFRTACSSTGASASHGTTTCTCTSDG